MINTHLPNKKDWAYSLEAIRRNNKIQKRDLARLAGMSPPTLYKVLEGEGTHDQLKAIEEGIRGVINAED